MKENCCKGECPALKYSFIADLDPGDRCKVQEYAMTVFLRKGQNLYEQGKDSQGFYCIQRGAVKVAVDTGNGESVTLDVHANHGMLGHHCLVSSKNFFTATCLSDAEICFIPKTIISSLKETNPSIDIKIRDKIRDEFIRFSEVISSLRSKSVLQRTAEVLIRLQNTFGKDPSGAIEFEFTKEELAKFIGSSVESVFRVLSVFRQKQYIDFERKKLRITNEVKLRNIGKIHT